MNSKIQYVVAPATPEKVVPLREIRIIDGKPQYVDVKPTQIRESESKDAPNEKINYVNSTVSRRIIDARTKLGLNQIQFAQKAGINVNILKSYENGTTVPSSLELQRLSAAAGENFRKKSLK